jgi:hypothetical protein
MGIGSLIGEPFMAGGAAEQPRLRRLHAFADRHAAALAAGVGLLIFAVNFVKWMIRWRGVPSWHSFADQGLYLKSARAFAAFDFSPASHHYPPLYPALAAPFTALFPNEPFAVIDAAVLGACAAMLVDLFGGVIGNRIVAALFTVVFLLIPGVAVETFVLPWTSTPATFFVVAALYVLRQTEEDEATLPRAFLFGLVLGLLVPTRPLDAVVALSLVPFWLFCVWRDARLRGDAGWLKRLATRLLVAGGGVAIGPAFLLASNYAVHGAPLTPYIADNVSVFVWNSLAAKFVAIFFDSTSLFAEPALVLMARFPWLTLAIGAVAVCLWYAPLWLRAAAVLVSVQFACYLVYDDLVPNGLYRYLNYHYFRWALWLAFLMLPAATALLYRRFGRALWRPLVALTAAAAVLAALQFETHATAVALEQRDGRIGIDLPRGGRVDYVEIIGLAADWHRTYQSDPQALIDGRPLRGFGEVREIPTATGTRLLFLHPLDGGRLELPDTGATSPLAALSGRYGFALGFPKWLGRPQETVRRGVPLRLDGPIGDYVFARGFAPFDGRGRILVADDATLWLGLAPHAEPYRLRLTISAGVPAQIELRFADSTAVTIAVDGQERDITLPIPPAAISRWGRPSAVAIGVRKTRTPSEGENRPKITAMRVE